MHLHLSDYFETARSFDALPSAASFLLNMHEHTLPRRLKLNLHLCWFKQVADLSGRRETKVSNNGKIR